MTMNDCDSLLVTLTGQWTVVKLLTSQLTSIVAASLVWREEGGVCTVSVVGRTPLTGSRFSKTHSRPIIINCGSGGQGGSEGRE